MKFGKIRFGETLTVAKKTKGDARNLETTVRNCGPFLRVAYIFSEPENGHTLGHPVIRDAVTTLFLGPLDGDIFSMSTPKTGTHKFKNWKRGHAKQESGQTVSEGTGNVAMGTILPRRVLERREPFLANQH